MGKEAVAGEGYPGGEEGSHDRGDDVQVSRPVVLRRFSARMFRSGLIPGVPGKLTVPSST